MSSQHNLQLTEASKNGDVAVVAALLARPDAEINYQERFVKPALITSSAGGHLEVVKLLLQAGADVNLRHVDEGTALYTAAWYGHLDIVRVLLEANADVNLEKSDIRDTPLMCAVQRNNLAVIKELLLAGARNGKTSLMCAADLNFWREKSDLNIVHELLQAQADVNLQDKAGLTALMYAAREGGQLMVQALVQAGTDVNIRTKTGHTALIYAVTKGSKEMVKVLLHSGAAVNQPTVVGDTALMKAVSNNFIEIAKVLVEARADVNHQDKYGRTTLMDAAELGHMEILKLLLTAGANVYLQNMDGDTALTLSKTPEIKNLLQQHKPIAGNGNGLFTQQPHKSTPVPVPSPVASTTPALAPTPASAPAPAPAPALSPASAPAFTPAPAQTPTAAEFTEQDRAALQTLSQASTQSLLMHGRLNEVMLTVAAHDRTLQLLVSKQKECPSLFWFYPKKRELRNWLSNPAKCLFQDTLMMMVVCPVTLCVVQCGPEGVGWEVSMPKKWVQKWGPAIIVSIFVMQAAVLAGRVVGIPLPQLPSVGNLTGLSSTLLGTATDSTLNQDNLMESLTEFASTTASVLEQQSPEMTLMLSRIQEQGKSTTGKKRLPAALKPPKPLAEEKVKQMTDDAYKSMHTFLTTGDNAKLGRLEDQLRGRMERVMAPNGDVDWVSVEGREMWLEQRKRMTLQLSQPSEPCSVEPPLPPGWNTKLPASAAPSVQSPLSLCPSPAEHSSWLTMHLHKAGIEADHISHCHVILVKGEGYASEELFVATSPEDFDAAYLKSVGITARGLQNALIALHRKLHTQHSPTLSTPATPVSDQVAATFTAIEKDSMLSTIQDLTSQLSKLRASTAAPNSGTSTSTTNGPRGGGRGGLALQQAQATAHAINPRTGLPYTMDDLSEEILRLQREVAQTNRDIGNVAAATREGFEDIQNNGNFGAGTGKKESKTKSMWSVFGSK